MTHRGLSIDDLAEMAGRATCADITKRLGENVRKLPGDEFPAFLVRLLENAAGGRMLVRSWAELSLEVQGVGSESVLIRRPVHGETAEAS